MDKDAIFNKLLHILKFTDTYSGYRMSDIEGNLDTYNALEQLEPHVKTCFDCKNWSCFKYPNTKYKYTIMVKHIFTNFGCLVISKHYHNPYDIVYNVNIKK